MVEAAQCLVIRLSIEAWSDIKELYQQIPQKASRRLCFRSYQETKSLYIGTAWVTGVVYMSSNSLQVDRDFFRYLPDNMSYSNLKEK